MNAAIHTLGGFSAHASQSQLIDWVNHFKEPRPELYLIHGEAEAKSAFRQCLANEGWSAEIPRSGDSISF